MSFPPGLVKRGGLTHALVAAHNATRYEVMMRTVTPLYIATLAFGFATMAPAQVQIDPDDIGGVVTSSKGPEAGVWVIAETSELPTKFARIVVTDDQGHYVLPDLPRANYQVFVRGYGLVDSARVGAKPGQHLDLKAVVAPEGRAAAEVYPANYWLSLMDIPKGDLSDKDVLLETKACYSCHQVGDRVTREIS